MAQGKDAMQHLVVTSPDGPPVRQLFAGRDLTIGRDPACDLVLGDGRISRQHARLRRGGDGSVTVEDLGSALGVQVNGRSISQPTVLGPDGRFAIDSLVFALEGEGAGIATWQVALLADAGGDEHPLADGTQRVGREADNQLVVSDTSLSRHHAELVVRGRQVLVRDLDSSNGTFVDGAQVREAELRPGGRVAFGRIGFRLIEAAATVRATLPTGFVAPPPPAGRRAAAVTAALLGLSLVALALVTMRPLRLVGHAKGLGPGADEQRFAAEVAAALATAQQALSGQAWSASIDAFGRVLALDPIHAEARLGLTTAEDNLVDQELLARARQAQEHGDPAATLALAGRVEPGHLLRPAADHLASDARTTLARRAEEQAQAACRTGHWQACYQAAATLLLYTPRAAAGQALAGEALDALTARRAPFAALGLAAQPAMLRVYPDSEVRQAVWRYAAGDWQTAQRRLRTFSDHAGARAALRLLEQVRGAKESGDRAAAAGATASALPSWEQAVLLDRQLAAGGPSVTGASARHRLAQVYVRDGAAAFDRGAYAAALLSWQHGLEAEPDHPEIPLHLARLESRGRELLAAVASQPGLDAAACARLRDIAATTPAGSRVHQEAAGQLPLCAEPHEEAP